MRKDATEFLSLFTRLEELRRPAKGLSEDYRKKNFEETASTSLRATELGIRIKLRLNPNELDHEEFKRVVGVLSDVCWDPPQNETDEQRKAAFAAFRKARDDVISQLQMVLKKEWETIKKGQI